VSLDPENAYAHYQLGLVQYRLKRYDQTIAHFERFIELMPDAPETPQVRSILRAATRLLLEGETPIARLRLP
jgi:regulator of sirC expression with transglutaminase-like and TPR domain